mmetsp:Transcript_55487/g.171924  ORF Transcript_55487/g.171924 Transcript_55487/m.171924 type:complete len:178 (-) Transcript_55487:2567-3100(-)
MSSPCVPCSTMRPSATTRMTLQSWIVERRWAIAKDVRPIRACSKASCTFCSLCVSNALVASSSSSTGGFRTSARQMATRCFWPPESRVPLGPTCVSQPCALWLSRKFRLAMRLHSSRCCGVISSPSSRPYFTFARTVVSKRMGSWPTKPTCFLHQRMFRVFRGHRSSPMRTCPFWGS